MKGSGPAESLRKVPKLTPALQRFIDGMGMYFESQGIPRMGGRMLGLLMIAHWPLSAEDLAEILRISRGSVSTNMRLLLSTGLVEKAPMPGSRSTQYVFSDEAMEHRITSGMKAVQAFKRLLLQASEAMPQNDVARHHIDDSLQVSDLLLEAFEQATQKWRSRHPAHTHGRVQREPAGD